MHPPCKAVVLLALALASGAAFAQSYPARPIRVVIGFPPGGGIDIVARMLAPRLHESLGQPIVVDNRAGANGIIAIETVAKAAADGYTLFFGTTGNLSVNPALYPKLPFNIERDFAPLTQVSSVPFLIYVNPSVPVRTLAELISHAKANPDKLHFYSSGNGGLPHLAGELLKASETVPGFEVVNLYGMVAPAGTPRAVIARLHAEIVKAQSIPDIREKLIAQATDPVGSTPGEFGAFRKAEEAKWARVIKEANIRPD